MKKSLILVIALIVLSAVSSFASNTGDYKFYAFTYANRTEIRALYPNHPTFATLKIEDQGDCVQFTVNWINETLLTPCTTGGGDVYVRSFAFNSAVGQVTVSGYPANWTVVDQVAHSQQSEAFDGYGTFEYIVKTTKNQYQVPSLTFTVCKTGTNLQIEDFEEQSWLKDGQVAENGLRTFGVMLANFCINLYEPDEITPINSAHFANDTTTAIELSEFKAISANRKVILVWQTETETDNAGFNILRADAEDGEYTQINDSTIPAMGSSVEGSGYHFFDTTVKNRQTYYYKLEDVDTFGISTLHGPVNATPRFIFGKGLLKKLIK